MPLYEYQCDACGHRFETIQKFSDPPITTCPKCGSSVRKLIASPAFQFKGTGWYITDYAKRDAGSKDQGSSAGSSSEKSAADKTGKDQSDKADKSDKSDAAKTAATSANSSAAAPSKES